MVDEKCLLKLQSPDIVYKVGETLLEYEDLTAEKAEELKNLFVQELGDIFDNPLILLERRAGHVYRKLLLKSMNDKRFETKVLTSIFNKMLNSKYSLEDLIRLIDSVYNYIALVKDRNKKIILMHAYDKEKIYCKIRDLYLGGDDAEGFIEGKDQILRISIDEFIKFYELFYYKDKLFELFFPYLDRDFNKYIRVNVKEVTRFNKSSYVDDVVSNLEVINRINEYQSLKLNVLVSNKFLHTILGHIKSIDKSKIDRFEKEQLITDLETKIKMSNKIYGVIEEIAIKTIRDLDCYSEKK